MTRSQRRIRNEKLRATSGGLPTAFREAGELAANPNDGKRKATPLPQRIRYSQI